MRYSQSQVLRITGISRARLSQIRDGYTRSTGVVENPEIVQGVHWDRDKRNGRPMYSHKLLEYLESRDNFTGTDL